MKSKFKILSVSCLALVGLLTACNGTRQSNPNISLPRGNDLSGTYSISYTTQESSGNVRHSGYLSAISATETNTVTLNQDLTYSYKKLVPSPITQSLYFEEKLLLKSYLARKAQKMEGELQRSIKTELMIVPLLLMA